MEENNDINKLSASDVQKLKMNPPENAWNRLDAELARKQALIDRGKANRYRMLFIITGLLLLCSVSYLYFTKSGSKTIATTENNKLSVVAGKNTPNTSSAENKETVSGTNTSINITPENNVTQQSNNNAKIKGNKTASANGIEKNKSIPVIFQKTDTKTTIVKSNTNKTKKTSTIINGSVVASSPPVSNSVKQSTTASNIAATPVKAINDPELNKPETQKESNEATAPPAVISAEDIEVVKPYTTDPIANDTLEKITKAVGLLNTNKTTEATVITNEPIAVNEYTGPSHYSNPKNIISRLSIAAFFSPDYSVNRLTKNGQTTIPVSIYESNEKIKFSHSTGLQLRFDLTNHWSVSLGGTYSTIAYSVSLPTIYAYNNSNNQLHYMYPTACGIVEIPNSNEYAATYKGESLNMAASCSQVVSFINIPLMARYQVAIKRFTLYADAGVEANLVMRERAIVSINNSETTVINNIEGLKKMNYGVIGGLGLQYNMGRGIGIFMGPSYRRSINSLTQNIPVNCYPYSFSWDIGMSVHF